MVEKVKAFLKFSGQEIPKQIQMGKYLFQVNSKGIKTKLKKRVLRSLIPTSNKHLSTRDFNNLQSFEISLFLQKKLMRKLF